MQEITLTPNASIAKYQEQRTERGVTVDALILAWLHSKEQLSHSPKTYRAYNQTIQDFRLFLQSQSYDLIFPGENFVHLIADFAQAFASQRSQHSHHKGNVSPGTQGQRFSILSSFYTYAIKRGHLKGSNPLLLIDRPHVEPYEKSRAIEHEELKRRLQEIDLSTDQGARDMAILMVFLHTGRRVSEVARLTRKDVLIAGNQVILSFLVKGGGEKRNVLDPIPSTLLLSWLTRFYGETFMNLSEETPLWVDLHHKESRGRALRYNGFAGICEHYLGTTKVHTTRHSFAVLMEAAGAKLTDIQQSLGHKNAATTGIYMERVTPDKNVFSGKISELLGF